MAEAREQVFFPEPEIPGFQRACLFLLGAEEGLELGGAGNCQVTCTFLLFCVPCSSGDLASTGEGKLMVHPWFCGVLPFPHHITFLTPPPTHSGRRVVEEGVDRGALPLTATSPPNNVTVCLISTVTASSRVRNELLNKNSTLREEVDLFLPRFLRSQLGALPRPHRQVMVPLHLSSQPFSGEQRLTIFRGVTFLPVSARGVGTV